MSKRSTTLEPICCVALFKGLQPKAKAVALGCGRTGDLQTMRCKIRDCSWAKSLCGCDRVRKPPEAFATCQDLYRSVCLETQSTIQSSSTPRMRPISAKGWSIRECCRVLRQLLFTGIQSTVRVNWPVNRFQHGSSGMYNSTAGIRVETIVPPQQHCLLTATLAGDRTRSPWGARGRPRVNSSRPRRITAAPNFLLGLNHPEPATK